MENCVLDQLNFCFFNDAYWDDCSFQVCSSCTLLVMLAGRSTFSGILGSGCDICAQRICRYLSSDMVYLELSPRLYLLYLVDILGM